MGSLIEREQAESILTLRLNRPEKLNSFIEPMAKELQTALETAADNDEIRCILLTGNGKAFCAGQDLPEVVEKGDDYPLGDTVRTSYNPVIKRLRTIEKPVVCAVNGTAAGAGANIAFACDIVLASTDAVFVQSFSKIGLIPDSGGTFFLPRLVGIPRANAMFMLDDKITAERAVEMGLIYKAVEPDRLPEESENICRYLAKMPTRGFGLYKRAINESFTNSLEAQLELEAKLQTEAGNTADYSEGVQAFMEKRKPDFSGR